MRRKTLPCTEKEEEEVIVAYWIILSSVLQSKLLAQYDTPSTPAKVTVTKDQLVSANVDIRPSLAVVASKIYISRRSKPNRPKLLLLCIISLCGDVELNPGPTPLDTTLYILVRYAEKK